MLPDSFVAHGSRGIYVVACGPVCWRLYMLPPDEPVCPVNKERAMAFALVGEAVSFRLAQAWEDTGRITGRI